MTIPHRPYVIGVIGAIGSGKSTVAGLLEQWGAIRIDADRICHQWLDRPEMIESVCRLLGDAVIDGNGRIDRKAVADRVFNNRRQLQRLNDLLHPPVLQAVTETIRQHTGDVPRARIVLEVALLLESGVGGLCDIILYVSADRKQRERRVVDNRGWTRNELYRREQYQFDNERKRAAADWIIENTGPLTHTQNQLTEFWRGLGR